MKTLKFRAWDKSKKSMITEMVGFVIDPNKKRFRFFRINKSQKNGIGTDVTDLKNIIVMQFTGKTDKNGKEVFEDDIVEWKHLNNKGIVYYNSDEVQYFVKAINDSGETESYLDSTHMEIIGNIYENPELI